jgi:hypothetical protein
VSDSTNGVCLCGAVTFAIAPPYRWFAHCHCSLCRKHHGSLFSTGLGVAHERLQWLSGADDIVHYRSSPAFERPFCRHCGSTVPGVTQDENFLHVPAGLLQSDPGARPRSHIFVASRSPLTTIADGLPQHATYPGAIGVSAIDTEHRERGAAGMQGSCLCNAVAFSAAKLPRHFVNCYCSLCRRQTGAAFKSTLFAAIEDFRWLRGENKIRRYALPPTLGSPRRGAPRHDADFCSGCGSPVPSLLEQQATAMLPAGAIDSVLPPLPAVHIHVASKAPWYEIAGDGPQFAEQPPPEQFTRYFR